MEYPKANLYGEASKQLGILVGALESKSLNCNIDLIGVAHEGIPKDTIIERAKAADIVTLELTRGVVRAGLLDGRSRVLEKSLFWRTVVSELKGEKDQWVRGVEVNQTPRVAWKRFTLHMGIKTLSPSSLTIEIDANGLGTLCSMLPGFGLEDLRRFNWKVTEDPGIYTFMMKRLEAVISGLSEEDLVYPVEIFPGVSLVCSSIAPKGSNNVDRYNITFITPPHSSLVTAFENVKTILDGLDILREDEIPGLAFDVMLTYLLSPAELAEVREIAYVTKQFVRSGRFGRNDNIGVVHIGGPFIHQYWLRSLRKF